MAHFRLFISAKPNTVGRLPVVHTTDAYAFRSIMKGKVLEPVGCPIFKEDLLYFFYGRPAYRVHYKTEATSLRAFNPVCFVVDAVSVNPPDRVLPFDSGAMGNNLFEKFLHPGMTIADFELDPSFDAADKLISFFFGSQKAYFGGQASQAVDVPEQEYEAECFKAIITSLGKTPYDDRRACIEIQIRRRLPLGSLRVHAVVLPDSMMDAPNIVDFITLELGAEAIPYETVHARPLEDTRVIASKVRDFCLARKWL